MIRRFREETALLVIDAQKGVHAWTHWGGPKGRRNNPDAEARIAGLLDAWRRATLPVYFTQHDSREQQSPLKLKLPSGEPIEGLEPTAGEQVVVKSSNSAFIGTGLEVMLRRNRVQRLVVAGFFTNMCIDTSVRMAGNLGFDTYLVHDACACSNRVALDGRDFDPDLVHSMSVANLHGEFCTALSTQRTLRLLETDAADLHRVQGNE